MLSCASASDFANEEVGVVGHVEIENPHDLALLDRRDLDGAVQGADQIAKLVSRAPSPSLCRPSRIGGNSC